MSPRALRLLAIATLLTSGGSCSDMATKPQPEVNVSGVIQARDGSPLAGATVGFFEAAVQPIEPQPVYPPVYPPGTRGAPRISRGAKESIVPTDAQGRFSITLPASRYEVWIGAVADSGFLPLHVADVVLRPPSMSLNYRYAGYRVTGLVTGPGATPVSNGYLVVSNTISATQSQLVGGRYSLLLPAGRYRFNASPQEVAAGIPRIAFVGIEVTSDTTIDLSLDGNPVSGTVTGPGGAPMEGSFVSASGALVDATSITPADGTYRLYLPSREYRFYVQPTPDYIASRFYPPVLITSPRTLDFDVSGVQWTGTVRNRATGDPVPGVRIELSGQSVNGGGHARFVTGGDGSFRFVLERSMAYFIYWQPIDGSAPFESVLSGPAANDSTFDLYVTPTIP